MLPGDHFPSCSASSICSQDHRLVQAFYLSLCNKHFLQLAVFTCSKITSVKPQGYTSQIHSAVKQPAPLHFISHLCCSNPQVFRLVSNWVYCENCVSVICNLQETMWSTSHFENRTLLFIKERGGFFGFVISPWRAIWGEALSPVCRKATRYLSIRRKVNILV